MKISHLQDYGSNGLIMHISRCSAPRLRSIEKTFRNLFLGDQIADQLAGGDCATAARRSSIGRLLLDITLYRAIVKQGFMTLAGATLRRKKPMISDEYARLSCRSPWVSATSKSRLEGPPQWGLGEKNTQALPACRLPQHWTHRVLGMEPHVGGLHCACYAGGSSIPVERKEYLVETPHIFKTSPL